MELLQEIRNESKSNRGENPPNCLTYKLFFQLVGLGILRQQFLIFEDPHDDANLFPT